MEVVYDNTFLAGELSVRAALADIRAALEQASIDADLLGRVEAVMAELFNNIVEHAYAGNDAGTLHCAVEKTKTGVIITVTDHGEAMPGGALPTGNLPDLDVDFLDLPEGGFGWFIIKTQTDGLTYDRVGSENRTKLTFFGESKRQT